GLISIGGGALLALQQRPQHEQDVWALGSRDARGCLLGMRRIEAQSHPQRAGIVRRNAEIILFEDADTLAFPEIEVVFLPLLPHGLLQKQARGKLRKTFGEPLIMIGSPANSVAEPLMRPLVRCDFLNESGEIRVNAAEQKPPLR